MRKIIPILVVAVVLSLTVFSSGCIGEKNKTPTIMSTDGVIIKQFYTDYDTYESTEKIPLYLEVENVGGTTAENVKVDILGASWTSNACPGESGTASCPQPLATELPPPDKTTGEKGGRVVKSWKIDPFSDLPEGVDYTGELTARVLYDYKSNGEVDIYVINKKYYRTLKTQGKTLPTIKSMKNSDGPIHLSIDTAGLPIIVDDSVTSSNPKEFQIRLYIKNVGSGLPIKKKGSDGEEGKITVNIRAFGKVGNSDVNLVSCEGENKFTKNGDWLSGDVILRRGGSALVICTIKLESHPELYTPISIIMKTDYRYFTEKSTPIRIIGVSGGESSGGGSSGGSEAEEQLDEAPEVNLVLPSDNSEINKSQTSSVTFNCTATDDKGLSKVELWTDLTGTWEKVEEKDASGTSYTATFTKDISDVSEGTYKWNCKAIDSKEQESFAESNYTIKITS